MWPAGPTPSACESPLWTEDGPEGLRQRHGPVLGRRRRMAAVDVLELLAAWSCGLATLLWLLIATVSRRASWERSAQWTVVATSLLAAVLLFSVYGMGGDLWGSRGLTRPMAVIAIVMAVVARMNLWGARVEQPKATIQRFRRDKDA